MALDRTIHVALSAAWYYKWSHPTYSRRLTSAEHARRCQGVPLNVLYDNEVDDNGLEEATTPRDHQFPPAPLDPEGGNPGTPHHPAWPSGHSTYSAAASPILEYFFSPGTLGDTELPALGPEVKPVFRQPA